MEKHSHFMFQCNKCRKVFTRRCYNHNSCRNLQSKDFDLMAPDGSRDRAAELLFEWKKNKLPNLVKSVEVGYLRNIRLLKEEYGPTSVGLDSQSVNTDKSEEYDDLFNLVEKPISPISSPVRKVVINKQKDFEDISDDELDFEDEVEEKDGSNNNRKGNTGISLSESSSESSSSSTSSSNTHSSIKIKKRKRTWDKFKENKNLSDSDSDESIKVPKRKQKLSVSKEGNKINDEDLHLKEKNEFVKECERKRLNKDDSKQERMEKLKTEMRNIDEEIEKMKEKNEKLEQKLKGEKVNQNSCSSKSKSANKGERYVKTNKKEGEDHRIKVESVNKQTDNRQRKVNEREVKEELSDKDKCSKSHENNIKKKQVKTSIEEKQVENNSRDKMNVVKSVGNNKQIVERKIVEGSIKQKDVVISVPERRSESGQKKQVEEQKRKSDISVKKVLLEESIKNQTKKEQPVNQNHLTTKVEMVPKPKSETNKFENSTPQSEIKVENEINNEQKPETNTDLKKENDLRYFKDRFVDIPLLEEAQKERIILKIGGQKLKTSRLTLTKFPEGLLAQIVGPKGMTPKYGNVYFIHRDPSHFRFFLNFLRNGCVDLRTLPHDLLYLYELYYEANFLPTASFGDGIH
ncbi:uncharacterized protein DDB_G0284459-like [Ruditapes philippinarum]|uniref:uncharacterized protein DDB_G0284459-like n=1 Tax=Ruditapes philippinarum TaxID=129788 RepID=UPI00295B8F1E|nr:uncharacterized protein DDB_G0284459-like [Ruditapes philippinarum]